VNFSRKN